MFKSLTARTRRWVQVAAAAMGLAAFTLPAAAGVSLTSANKTQVSALGEIITYTFTISGENAIITGLTTLTMNAPVTNIQCVGLPLAVNGTTTCTADHAVDAIDIGLGFVNQVAAGTYNLTTNGGPRSGTVGGTTIQTPYVPPPPPTVTSVTPNSGPIAGGTAVTIAGSGFTGATGATIGGASVTSFVVVNNTTITGVTPARTAGAKTVTVQHPNGNGSLSSGFTYLSGTPNLSINNVTSSEGNSGTTQYNFTVTLDQPAPAGGVTFSVATAAGTATENTDYQGVQAPLVTIAAGDTSAIIQVPVIGDTAFEPNETFFVNVTNVTGANVTDGQGLGTINNDDNQPTVSINDVSQNEGNSGTSNMTFTVSLSNPSGSTITVDYATGAVSATAGSDYTTTTGTLTFNPGETSKPISVPILGDTTFEGNESFTVDLSNLSSGASFTDAQGSGGIVNDDAAPPTVTAVTPNAGRGTGGVSVTITGTNLTGATAVTFGGNPATGIVVNSATSITATTPAGADGTVNVAVTTPGGTGTGTALYTYDGTAPGFAGVPGNLVQATDGGLPTATVTYSAPTATDNRPGATIIQTAGLPSGAAFPIGVTTNTFQAIDAVGNSAAISFTVTVVDQEQPVLAVPADVTATTDTGVLTRNVTYAPPTATDNSGETITVVQTAGLPSGSNFPIGLTTNTFSATDSAGNTRTRSFFVTISQAGPTVANVSPDAGRGIGGTSVTITGTNFLNVSGVTFGGNAAASFNVVNATTITATTPAGATGTVNVAVATPGGTGTGVGLFTYDATNPGFSGVPANISGPTDTGLPTRVVTYTAPTPTDNRPGATITQTAGLPSGSAFPIGVTTNTFQAQDAVGNTATVSFTVTITDNQAPVLAGIPANITGPTDPGLPTRVVNYALPTATDNSGETITVVQTAGLPPGSAFPVGTTTNTFRAQDSAGNFSTASFTVRVNDEEFPTILNLPANQSFTIDFPATTRVVTWTPPTATDNVSGVTITQTGGPAPGSAFPLGVTIINYAAKDAANQVTTASFTVTVTQTAPGSVRFVINSQADGTYNFTSAESVLNFSVTSTGGTGQSAVIQIRPGTFSLAFTTPSGAGVASASCTPSNSTVNTVARTASVVVASNVATVCTLTGLPAREEAQKTIGAGLQASAALIVANAPDVGRRLSRLNGGDGGADGSVSAFGKTFASNLPFSATIGADEVRFAMSLSGLRASRERAEVAANGVPAALAASVEPAAGLAATAAADAAAAMSNRKGPRFDVWVEGVIAQFNAAASSEGDFAIIHGGADYLVTDDILLGVGIQGDWLNLNTPGGSLDSSGYMAGPYLTARLAPNLYLDARAAWGGARYDVSPFGTYTDSVNSSRELYSGALIGEFVMGDLTIRPEARVTWYNETTEAYVDSLSVAIPSVEIKTGEASFGPDFEWTLKQQNGGTLMPHVGFDLIWTFEQENTATAFTNAPGLDETGIRARIDAGLTYESPDGVSLGATVFYDGLGEGEFEAWGGTATLRFGF